MLDTECSVVGDILTYLHKQMAKHNYIVFIITVYYSVGYYKPHWLCKREYIHIYSNSNAVKTICLGLLHCVLVGKWFMSSVCDQILLRTDVFPLMFCFFYLFKVEIVPILNWCYVNGLKS